MNTMNNGREEVSALVDNELSNEQIESALAMLNEDERAAWDIYHQIGDVMRSDELGQAFSADFNARLSARLVAEPVIVAPSQAIKVHKSALDEGRSRSNSLVKRFAFPVMALAVATVAVITNPRLLTPAQNGNAGAIATAQLQAASTPLQSASNYALVSSSAPAAGIDSDSSVQNGVILRDPRIDEYLLAHQRFSPSLYSTARYVRNSPIISESNK
jgi:sigma-E factor negative regulatory protein RseA